ncbi:hypothetical protein [Microcoleus sp. B3-D7]|uniref:hypothetical protein n=1 Tax=Microcoleus sp. B3-D7 TaxID=2818659 RepID=UPI002FD6D1E7
MVQAFDKISRLLRLAIAVIDNPRPENTETCQSSKDSNYNTEILAHRQTVERIRKVHADYQLRGWIR